MRPAPQRLALTLCAAAVMLLAAAPVSRAEDLTPLLEAGIPALDREWSGTDYTAAAEVLSAGKVPLPVMTDARGRILLERLTALENLSLARNETLPLQQRLADAMAVLVGGNRITKLYLPAANRGEAVHEELARQAAFQLHVVATVADLLARFVPTIPRDAQYESRMAGLRQVTTGVAQIYVGTAISLSERSFYSGADLSRLLAAASATLPRARALLTPGVRVELRVKLEKLRPAFRGEDRRHLDGMIAELTRA